MKVKFNYQFSEELDYPWQWGEVSNEEAPPDTGSTEELTAGDILKELSADDEEGVEEKEEVEEEVEDKEDKEEEEETLELSEEETEEEVEAKPEEELVVPVKIKEIEAKYPNFFKDFPSVKAYYFKARQYSEILPTIEDAKEAAESHQTLQNFRGDLEKGNITRIISAIKEHASEQYPEFVDNYLHSLATVDRDAYLHATHNVLANTIQFALNKAKEEDDEELRDAVLIVNKFLFDQKEPIQPIRLSKKRPEENNSIDKERKEFEAQRFNETIGELNNKIDNQIKNTIDSNIDKKNQMSSFLKRAVIEKVQNQFKEECKKDKAFTSVITRLQESAKKDKYSKSSLDKIRSVHLTQAKNILPRIIARVKAEALKGTTRKVEKQVHRNNSTSSETSSARNTGNKVGYNKEGRKISTIDFLSS